MNWAKHIIKRFGEKDAHKFALSTNSCPCDYLSLNCYRCEHETIQNLYWIGNMGCDEAIIYNSLNFRKRRRIKKKIRRLTKN